MAIVFEKEGQSMEPTNPFDIAPIKWEMATYSMWVQDMVDDASAHQVIDDASNSKAVQMSLQAKKLSKKIKDKGAEKTKEHRAFVTSVRNLVRMYTDMLNSIEADLKKKIREYSSVKEIERREAEKRAQAEAARLQERINAEAKEKGIEPVQVPEVALPEKQQPVRTEEGSASVRKRWTWDHENYEFEKVPDGYKILDQPTINKAIKAGIRSIPGITIYEDKDVILRG